MEVLGQYPHVNMYTKGFRKYKITPLSSLMFIRKLLVHKVRWKVSRLITRCSDFRRNPWYSEVVEMCLPFAGITLDLRITDSLFNNRLTARKQKPDFSLYYFIPTIPKTSCHITEVQNALVEYLKKTRLIFNHTVYRCISDLSSSQQGSWKSATREIPRISRGKHLFEEFRGKNSASTTRICSFWNSLFSCQQRFKQFRQPQRLKWFSHSAEPTDLTSALPDGLIPMQSLIPASHLVTNLKLGSASENSHLEICSRSQ